MSEILKALQERRNAVTTQMRSLIEAASVESRDWTPDEQGKFDGMTAELERIDARIKAVADGETRAKDVGAAFDAIDKAPVTGPRTESRDLAELRKIGQSAIAGKPGATVIPHSGTEFRTLSKLTAAAGANTVPTLFYDQLVAHLILTSGILQANPTVLRTESGANLQVPKTTAHSTGALVAEAGVIPTSDPTFGQITLGAYKYGALIQVSTELINDTGVDLEGYLSMQLGRALGNAFGVHMATGTGGGVQPRGVVTDATLGVTGGAAVAGAFTYDNLTDLFFSVIPQYRMSQSCYWLCNDTTLGALRKIKDTQNRPLWEPSLQAGVPDTYFGKPIVTDPNIATVALSAKSVLFGDFSQYFVRFSHGGLRFEASADFAFNTDLVTYRALLRADAALIDLTGCLKYFQGNAA
jgi:HK97 family phage major capsid protein